MSLPPGPQTPAIWQMFNWITSPLSFIQRCAQDYGDCCTIKLLGGDLKITPLVAVSHPQALQTILTSDEENVFDASGDLGLVFEPVLGTQSLFRLSGDQHRRMKKLMMPAFHGERLRSYGRLIHDITEDVIRGWIVGKSFSAQESMQTISLRVILGTVFGLAEGPRYQKMEILLQRMLNGLSNPLGVSLLHFPFLRKDLGLLSPWGNFIRRQYQIDKIIYDEIAERRAHPKAERNDILTLLMSAHDEDGNPLEDMELRDELMTLLVAGYESTAAALTWALYWVHKIPKVREKLLYELRGLDDPFDPSALLRLPYLNSVYCETLRIYPVFLQTFPRIVRSPVELMGYLLEPGTMVIGFIYLTHHREDIYPEPDRFKPERFLERQFSSFEYLPFGGGSRRCIGMAFAQFQIKVVLSKILSQVELVLAGTHSVHLVYRTLSTEPSPVKLLVKRSELGR